MRVRSHCLDGKSHAHNCSRHIYTAVDNRTLSIVRLCNHAMLNLPRSSIPGEPAPSREATPNALLDNAQSGGGAPNGLNAPGPGYELKLGDFSVDEYRPFKVIIVGAGFSGIAAGVR